MTTVRFLYDNKWRKGSILIPSSEDPKYPAMDTQVDSRLMFYRASSKTSPCNVPNDLGAAYEINFVSILGHNFESSGVTIKFQGADNSAFDSGLETRTLSYNATDIFTFITSFTKRYVRVRLEKATDFTDYPQFSTILCGKYFEPNRSFVKPYQKGRDDLSEIELAEDSGVLFSQEKPILDSWLLPFKGLNDTAKGEVLSLLEDCGIHKAFIVIFDYNNPNSDSHLVRLEGINPPEYQHVDYWNWEANIKEVK